MTRQIDVIRQDRALEGKSPLFFIRLVDGAFEPENIDGLWISLEELQSLIIKMNNALLAER